MELSNIDMRRIMMFAANMYGPNGTRGAPLFFIGDPGGGKTTMAKDAARHYLGGNFTKVVLSRIESTDLGLPVRVDGKRYSDFVPPRRLYELSQTDKTVGGLFLLDEFTRARTQDVQAAVMDIMLEHETEAMSDDTSLKHVVVWATGNPAAQVGGLEIDPAAANRFVWCPWPETDLDKWIDYQAKQDPKTGKTPKDGWPEVRQDWREAWDDTFVKAAGQVFSFLRTQPGLLREPTPETARAWSSERSWELFKLVLTSCYVHGATVSEMTYLLAGCVGDGPATSFLAWLDADDLPSAEDTLQGKVKLDKYNAHHRWLIASAATDKLVSEKARGIKRDVNPFGKFLEGMSDENAEIVGSVAARIAKAGFTDGVFFRLFAKMKDLRTNS